MLTFLTFKWRTPEWFDDTRRAQYTAEQVNVLEASIRRNYPHPHRFLCITDEPEGITGETLPLWDQFSDVRHPMEPCRTTCYRRLKLWDAGIADIVGARRFVCVDLDAVITGDLSPLFNRDAPLVVWQNSARQYNGSLILMTAGVLPEIYANFDPVESTTKARLAGYLGTDQAWISYTLHRTRPPVHKTWTHADGVLGYRNCIPKDGRLPGHAKIVFFYGKEKPWHRLDLPWVKQHWRL